MRIWMKQWIDRLRCRSAELKRDLAALIYAYRDPRLPWYARAFAFFVVARTLSPIDLIPDFIPVLGQLDDVILTPLYLVLAFKLIPDEILADARRSAASPTTAEKWGGAGYWVWVIVLWAVVLWLLGRFLWQLFTHSGWNNI